ncbi:MAG: hypothetical protein ABS81_26355 [Pseudonocardia sp. SCN 72-86]|nr:MAG: hypothetical protein ABS81_26355 [Pseudonocardia sp. SCN 72-86]
MWWRRADGVRWSVDGGVAGPRPPHGGEKSTVALRERRGGLQAAELLANLVEHVAEQRMTSADQVRAAARTHLRTQQRAEIEPARVLGAAEALRDMESRWAELAEGEELTVRWPDPPPRQRGRRRHP